MIMDFCPTGLDLPAFDSRGGAKYLTLYLSTRPKHTP